MSPPAVGVISCHYDLIQGVCTGGGGGGGQTIKK